MNEILTIFATELARKIRSRIFVVGTLAGAIFIALMAEAPLFFSHAAHSSTDNVILAGPANLRARATRLMQAKKDFHVVASVASLPPRVDTAYLDAHEKAAAALALSVRHGRLQVDVYPRDLAAFDEVQFRSLVPLSVEVATGLTPARADPGTTVQRSVHPINAKFTDSKSASLAHGVAFGLIFVLYFAIVFASQSVMSSVAEEKTSRIAEILIATISPVNLLTGKTLAAAVLAIVQIGIWMAGALLLLPRVAAVAARDSSGGVAGGAAVSPAQFVDPSTLVAFVIFFVLGYLQYATIYAAAASLISRTEDLGSVTTPVVMPVIGAFLVAQYALVQPNSPVAVAFSFVPFFSPFVIFSRIAVAEIPGWEVAVAVVVNILTVAAAFYCAGKIYRVGMLLYGRLPSLKQVWSALRA